MWQVWQKYFYLCKQCSERQELGVSGRAVFQVQQSFSRHTSYIFIIMSSKRRPFSEGCLEISWGCMVSTPARIFLYSSFPKSSWILPAVRSLSKLGPLLRKSHRVDGSKLGSEQKCVEFLTNTFLYWTPSHKGTQDFNYNSGLWVAGANFQSSVFPFLIISMDKHILRDWVICELPHSGFS